MIGQFAALFGSARLAFHPLPDLCGVRRVGVDDEVFVYGSSDLALNLAAHWVVGNRVCGWDDIGKSNHAAFFGAGGQGVLGFVYLNRQRLGMVVPAEFLGEEGFQVKVIQELASAVAIDVHQGAFFCLSLAGRDREIAPTGDDVSGLRRTGDFYQDLLSQSLSFPLISYIYSCGVKVLFLIGRNRVFQKKLGFKASERKVPESR